MSAFQGAVDLGYRFLETDLHRTRDGVLVVFHDDSVDRTTDGTGPVAAKSLAELSALDAAYRFAPHQGFPEREMGVRIPQFDEVWESFPDARFILDLKASGLESDLAEFLRRRGGEERVIVGSFSDRRLARFRRVSRGRVATSSGPAETLALWTAARFGRSLPTKADVLQIPEDFAFVELPDRKMVAAAERGGRQVHVWTVNDPDRMTRLLDNGVHAIITDRPDLLKQLMTARGEWAKPSA